MLAALALLGVLGSAAPTAAAPPPSTSAVQPPVRVRLWAEEGRDLFRGGERSRLWVRTTDDAYVAVIHLAPDGRLEFLYPSSPWESGYLRRGRDLSIGRAGGGVWTVGRGTGIGYVYAIASTQPLDFRFFRQTRLGGWSFGRGGEVVRGDPFYVFDRVAEQLVPQLEGGRWNGFDDAIYSYHVGRRHSYPLYSCYDPYAGVVVRSSWGAPLYSCLQMRELLVGYPDYYYAPRRTRRVYLSDRRSAEPRYRFKEPADARASRPVAPSARSQPAPRLIPTEAADRPVRQRPTLERRAREEAEPPPRSAEPIRPRAEPRSSRPVERSRPVESRRPESAEPRQQEQTRPSEASSPRVRRPGG